MSDLGSAFYTISLLLASFGLGALPLTRWLVLLLAGRDLTKIGTGNGGVSAAFLQGGKLAGIAAVLAEIARGMAPVLVAKVWFPDAPALAMVALTALVGGRFAIAKGGGVTNATWGIFAYSPPVAIGSGMTGLLILSIGQWWPGESDRWRLWAARWGCLSGPIWVWVWRQSPLECLATAGLAFLLVAINLRQADDMILLKRQQFCSLNDKLDPKICGEKATRLALLKQAGFQVPNGWVLPPLTTNFHFLIPIFQSLIVRSSAVGEDSDTSSAAGQYETIGPVNTESELEAAINQCRQSYWSAEAIDYRRQRQLPDTGMAVLIQPYIQSRVAGVMFSHNPLDGGTQVIIEALPGGAEGVVSGQVTPLHLEIDFSSPEILDRDLLQTEDLQFLPKEIIAYLVKKAQAIEEFFHGVPQDIEWSWDGETLWILQSRPITNLRPIWTRTIAAEVIPGAIHPLTWSINRPLTCGVWGEIFQVVLGERVTGLDFKETATLLGSHAYFNATLLGEFFRMMGLPEEGLEFLVRGKKMGKPPFGRVFKNLPGLGRLVLREGNLEREFKRDLATIFRSALAKFEERENRVEGRTVSELLERAEEILILLKPLTYYNILGPIGLAIRKALFRVADEWLINDNAPEIASVRKLQQLADKLRENFQSTDSLSEALSHHSEFQNWLDTYGYLSEVGTDIAVPTWREQPEHFRQLLITMAQKSADFRGESSQKLKLNFWQRWRLAQCQKRAIIKNQICEIYGRLLAHLRWIFLEIEKHGLERQVFEEVGDIFYLEFGEIQRWIRSGEEVNFKEMIRERRDQLQEDIQRVVPPVVYGNLLPKSDIKPSIYPENTSILQGIPASVGCVEGTVKIYRTVAGIVAGEKMILVVPYTDAGWAPLLLQAKAIIAEVGGQLSHGAIIAREYKIPAVMNVSEAMTRLKDGQRVRVDGYRGTVELLE